MLAGPFMALFANILSIPTCLFVLDRVVLQKTSALVKIVQNVLKKGSKMLLGMEDTEAVHLYMVK